MQSKGGKARWKGTTKEERSKHMKAIRLGICLPSQKKRSKVGINRN